MFLAPVGLALKPPYRGPWGPPHLELSSRAASSSSLSKRARTKPACPGALQTPAEWYSPPQSWPSPPQATHQRAEPQARSNTAHTCLGRTRGCQGALTSERGSGGGAGQHGRAVWEPQADLPMSLESRLLGSARRRCRMGSTMWPISRVTLTARFLWVWTALEALSPWWHGRWGVLKSRGALP